jgi:hypothetical protein
MSWPAPNTLQVLQNSANWQNAESYPAQGFTLMGAYKDEIVDSRAGVVHDRIQQAIRLMKSGGFVIDHLPVGSELPVVDLEEQAVLSLTIESCVINSRFNPFARLKTQALETFVGTAGQILAEPLYVGKEAIHQEGVNGKLVTVSRERLYGKQSASGEVVSVVESSDVSGGGYRRGTCSPMPNSIRVGHTYVGSGGNSYSCVTAAAIVSATSTSRNYKEVAAQPLAAYPQLAPVRLY